MTKVYNKLVRDKIPQIIRASGKTCTVARASDEQYLQLLDQKLEEELAEYQESKSLDELADLVEVIAATAEARGYSWDALMQERDRKRAERGGFEEQLLLLNVQDGR